VCEGAFDALALLAVGVSRVVAIFGVHGWRWDWVREVHELVFALDAATAGQQQWRQLARQAALRGKRVAVLPAAAYGGHKDVNEAWVAGTLAVDAWSTPAAEPGARLAVPADLSEAWEDRVAIMLADGHLRPADAARLAWEALQGGPPSSKGSPRWAGRHARLTPWGGHPHTTVPVVWYERACIRRVLPSNRGEWRWRP